MSERESEREERRERRERTRRWEFARHVEKPRRRGITYERERESIRERGRESHSLPGSLIASPSRLENCMYVFMYVCMYVRTYVCIQ